MVKIVLKLFLFCIIIQTDLVTAFLGLRLGLEVPDELGSTRGWQVVPSLGEMEMVVISDQNI
jgi:hypothetical protein